jgi:hypothetical protein
VDVGLPNAGHSCWEWGTREACAGREFTNWGATREGKRSGVGVEENGGGFSRLVVCCLFPRMSSFGSVLCLSPPFPEENTFLCDLMWQVPVATARRRRVLIFFPGSKYC